jgi:hypothetical protein
VFDLLIPFEESSDAKLRGNASYAYAALVESPSTEVRDRARDRLLSVIGMEAPAGAGVDWERRFASRALEAFRGLPPEEFEHCSKEVVRLSNDGELPAQRSMFARFALSINEVGKQRVPLGWLPTLRMLWRAGRPGLGTSLWAAIWRSFLVYFAIWWVADSAGAKVDSNGSVQILAIWMLTSTALVLLSLGGRFQHSKLVHAEDVLLCALAFALLGWLSLELDSATTVGPAGIATNVLIGFILGAALRLRRWIANATGGVVPRGLALWEPVAHFAIATLMCMTASFLGGNSRALGAAWAVLAPTVLIVSSLDEWLARKAVQPLRPPSGRTINPGWVLGPGVVSVVAALWWGFVNWGINIGNDPWLFKDPATINLPDDLVGPQLEVPKMNLGTRVPYRIKKPGPYRFSATPATPDKPIELHIVAPGGIDDPPTQVSGAQGPAVIEQDFERGSYRVCMAPVDSKGCDESASKVKTFSDFGAALIGTQGGSPSQAAARPRLVVSVGRSASAPAAK